MIQKFKAKLINSDSELEFAILINIENTETGEKFRDHVWVKNTKKLKSFSEHSNVLFNAHVYEYVAKGGIIKEGIKNLRKIRLA